MDRDDQLGRPDLCVPDSGTFWYAGGGSASGYARECCGALIGDFEPPPVVSFNPEGRAPVLLVCDHASAAIPLALDRLGLARESLSAHIASDLGAAEITRRLALRLNAQALLSSYSRLICDLNRAPDEPSLIPEISDGIIVPGNRRLGPSDVERRLETFFHPYHRAIAHCIGGFRARGVAPALISVHTFTPNLGGSRPWQVGVLWDQDARLPVPLMARLRDQFGLTVGDNQPYSGRTTQGGTIETHATPAGLPNVLIEVRQDLVSTPADARRWADLLADALEPLLADPALYQVEHHPRPVAAQAALAA